jgi:hypothetical protein
MLSAGSSSCEEASHPTPEQQTSEPARGPATSELLCPSFAPRAPGRGVVIGVVAGTAAHPKLIPLDKPEPVTEEIFKLAAPHHPSEIFRIAAPCVEGGCKNFGNGFCHLAKAVVKSHEAVDDLPLCRIRSQCVWWHQEGKPACLRCPEVVTNNAATLAIRSQMER